MISQATPAQHAQHRTAAVREFGSRSPARELVTTIQKLSLARDLNSVMRIVRGAARRLTGADGATFVLRDGDQCFYADEDAIGPLWKGRRFDMETCISGWSMLHRVPVVIEDVYKDPRIPVAAYQPTFVKSLVIVPIRPRAPIGAIGNYWARPRLADRAEVEVLQSLADSTSIALENVDLYQNLERRVRERTAELEVANRELEAFSYSVAHDLRAPLTIINGYADLLSDVTPTESPGHDALGGIGAAAHRMGDLIDGLLLLAGVTRTQLQAEELDLTGLAGEVAQEVQAQHPEREVAVQVQPGLTACGDPNLLRTALENLVGNAWKYTGRCAEPSIRVGRHRDESETFYVQDNGVGFDPAKAHKLFMPFSRLHSASDYAGTGIGLTIVSRIILRHGGRVWATSEQGRGATFWFTLPRSSAPLPGGGPEPDHA